MGGALQGPDSHPEGEHRAGVAEGEIAGLDASKRLQITQWTAERGAKTLKTINGGMIGDTTDIAPRGLIALKLEEIN